MDNIPLCLSILLLIALSAFFSATETAFSSLNLTRIKSLSDAGHARATQVWTLSQDFDRLLSTILIGNNIVNILSASLATILFTRWLGNLGVSVSTVAMTVLVLIFGEISPKSLAKQNPERYAMAVAPIVRVTAALLKPLNALFAQWRKLLARMFGAQRRPGVTDAEIRTLVEAAEQDGGLEEHEGDLIRSAIAFNDLKVEDILTARVDITAVEEHATPEEVAEVFRDSGYSRLPVYRGNLDTIVGVIHEKDFYKMLSDGGSQLATILAPLFFVPPYTTLPSLLRRFQTDKRHMAVVVDEFGGTMGMVTLEDILEELVGEIWDEHDEAVSSIAPVSVGVWRVLGQTRLGELFEHWGIQKDAESYDVSTVGGWVCDVLGRLPEPGEHFGFEGYEVTVTLVADRRVLEVEIAEPRDADEKSDE
ncbi:MAG TPA: hemolysin family protein [Clostridia bacterium]|nr:hemolysin family protein [Clostridia bacterium]